jgi:hypothetical protein
LAAPLDSRNLGIELVALPAEVNESILWILRRANGEVGQCVDDEPKTRFSSYKLHLGVENTL